jgi:hypothetical protein
MSDIEGKEISVWFSCGAASAVAAKRTVEIYGDKNNVRVLNSPIKEEHEDNRRFLRDCQDWIGREIEEVVHPQHLHCSAEEIWKGRKYISGPAGAPCTMLLKREARQLWERHNVSDHLVLGFTAEEKKRHDRFILTERGNVLPVLIDLGITKDDCYAIVDRAGIKLPEIYRLGYPNANCIGCVKASSATYWNHVRSTHPDVFKDRAELSRELGAKLAWHKGKRIFLDNLPADAVGRPMRTMRIECNLFCEERDWNND